MGDSARILYSVICKSPMLEIRALYESIFLYLCTCPMCVLNLWNVMWDKDLLLIFRIALHIVIYFLASI